MGKTTTALPLSERFETAFNRIHKVLKGTVKQADTDKFTELVHKGHNHVLIRHYKEDLCQYAKLRNAIVHEKVNADYYIAEPHLDVVEDIERIAGEFEKPRTGLSISTKEVYYFYENDYLKDILSCMKKTGHTRFPIYQKEDQYRWLLTTKEIISWLANQFDNPKIDLEKVKVKELYTKEEKRVVFISQHTTVFEIEDIYEEIEGNRKKIEAIIITATGKQSEKPNGIITSRDLLGVVLAEE